MGSVPGKQDRKGRGQNLIILVSLYKLLRCLGRGTLEP